MTAFVGANVLNSYTSAELVASGVGFSLGDRFEAHNGKTYVFVQATSAIAANDTCTYDETYAGVVAPISTSNDAGGDRVGVAPAAIASGSYGWLQIYGPCTVRTAAAAAANTRLNTTATAGAVDDDGTAGSFAIEGMVLTAAAGSATTAAAILDYPRQRVPVL